MQPLPKKEPYLENIQSSKELLQKELDTNRAEQNLLKKRMDLMNEFVNTIPSFDPQYSSTLYQIDMDQVEIDELRFRESLIIDKLTEL